ncbi:MAG: tetratricopeptide repeat protein [Acidobacteriales bacterium]|nr:tetratricopeptide repeat protein [Terriglobales bacterium]
MSCSATLWFFLLNCWSPPIANGQSGRTIESIEPKSQGPVLPVEMGSRISELAVRKRWKEVAESAQRKILAEPSDPDGFYWLGTARLELHDSIGAVQALRSAQDLGMSKSILHENLGRAYYNLNQFILFQQQMEEASRLDPRSFKPNYFLGLYHLAIRSDVATALTFFDKATKLAPNDWKSLYQEGRCLELGGKSNEALEYYARAIRILEKSNEPFGWPFQAMAHLMINQDPQQALDFAKKAVEREPHEYSNHLTLAQVYERLGNIPEAIGEAKVAENQSPNANAVRYLLFMLYRKAGNQQAAQAELEVFQKLKAIYGSE